MATEEVGSISASRPNVKIAMMMRMEPVRRAKVIAGRTKSFCCAASLLAESLSAASAANWLSSAWSWFCSG
ncbi:hypothetical protein WP1_197 [Pseudomonas phage WP1]